MNVVMIVLACGAAELWCIKCETEFWVSSVEMSCNVFLNGSSGIDREVECCNAS